MSDKDEGGPSVVCSLQRCSPLVRTCGQCDSWSVVSSAILITPPHNSVVSSMKFAKMFHSKAFLLSVLFFLGLFELIRQFIESANRNKLESLPVTSSRDLIKHLGTRARPTGEGQNAILEHRPTENIERARGTNKVEEKFLPLFSTIQ